MTYDLFTIRIDGERDPVYNQYIVPSADDSAEVLLAQLRRRKESNTFPQGEVTAYFVMPITKKQAVKLGYLGRLSGFLGN